MTKLAPSDLEEPIAQALLHIYQGSEKRYAVRSEVLDAVRQNLGLEGEAPLGLDENGKSHFDAYASKAMYVLKSRDVTKIPKRGFWALTEKGAALYESRQAGMSSAIADILEFSKGDLPQWAHDEMIVGLVIRQLLCFGKLSAQSQACSGCAVRRQCGEKTFATFLNVVGHLPQEDPDYPEGGISIDSELDLDDDSPIAYSLNIDQVCWATGVTLTAGTSCWFIPGHGRVVSDQGLDKLKKEGKI